MPTAFLLPGDPGRVDFAASVLRDFVIVGQNREFRLGYGYLGGVLIGVCSTGIGGASAEIATVELAAMGARILIRTGGCGALAQDLQGQIDLGRRPDGQAPATPRRLRHGSEP